MRVTRKRPRILLICLLAALATLLLEASPAQASKHYGITQVDIAAQLHPDGSLEVTESRTYDFHGSYRYAYRVIPLGGPETYRDLGISENGRAYRPAESRKPGTFRITEQGDQVEIRWFFRASNEVRTFDFHYRVENLIRCHDDAALLYFKFIGDDWEKPSSNVRLALNPPQPLARDGVRAWLHSPLWAQLVIGERGECTAWCERLPKRTYLEIRALYPPEIFPRVAPRAGTIRARVMEEEARWAEEANRQRGEAREHWARRQARRAIGVKVLPAVVVIGFLAWVFLFRRYGRRPDVPAPLDLASTPPAATPPALVGYLLHSRQTSARDLVATLLDLAQRGFLVMREGEREKRRFLGGTKKVAHYVWELKREHYREKSAELLKYEDELIRFLFDDLAAGEDAIDLATFRKRRKEITKFFTQWKKEVKAVAEERGFFERESLRGRIYSILLGVAMMVLGVLSFFLFDIWALLLAGAGALVLVLSFTIPHRTPQGEIEAQGWQALRRYLRKYDFRGVGRSDLLAQINTYLVYGMVLGLSKKVYDALTLCIPPEASGTYVPWYICHGSQGGGFSPAAFGSAFSAMVATTTSTVSSAVGTGGGASGGGGGGAGGGGGGAG